MINYSIIFNAISLIRKQIFDFYQIKFCKQKNTIRIYNIFIFVLTIAIILVLLKFASITNINSDYVQNVLEVTSILHGNIFLHGWTLTSDNFYLSDNPFFLLGRLIWGRSAAGIYVPPFLIYVFLLASALLIVNFSSNNFESKIIGFCAILFYIATPGIKSLAPVVFVGAQHIAVLAFCLYGWLILDRIQKINKKFILIILYTLCIFIVFFSDPLGSMMFMPPTFIGLYFAFMASKRSNIQVVMGSLTLAVFLFAHLALFIIHAAGGFTIAQNFSLNFVSAANFGQNIEGELFGLLHLSGAYFFGRPAQNFRTVVSVIRLVGLGIMGAAMITALRRGLRGNEGWNLRFVLAIAVLVDLASSAVSATFNVALVPSVLDGGAAVRYLTPAILFGGLLVALELPTLMKQAPNRKARIGYIALSTGGVIATTSVFLMHGVWRWHDRPAVTQSSSAVVGKWLFENGLTRGVGPYWNASIITAVSGQRVLVRAVINQNGHLIPFNWLSNSKWYNKRKPQFVIYVKNNQFGVNSKTIKETYGSPLSTLTQDGYEIAIFEPHPGAR